MSPPRPRRPGGPPYAPLDDAALSDMAKDSRVGQASLGARRSLLLCRAGTLERNEVGLAELVDVDNAVFWTLALVVVKLPGRLHDVRPRCQFLRGASVAFDGMDPGPLHTYRVLVRSVSVHAQSI